MTASEVSPKHRSGAIFRTVSIVALFTLGFLLLAEHRAHVYSAVPYLFLLACPLMHLFMHHGGHGAGRDHVAHRSSEPSEEAEDRR